MDEIIGWISFGAVLYFSVNWAADNPQQVAALRDSTNALVVKAALMVQDTAAGIVHENTPGNSQ